MQIDNRSSSLEALNQLWDAEEMIRSGDFNAKDVAWLIGRSRMNLGGYLQSKGEREHYVPRVLSRKDAYKIADIFGDHAFHYFGIEDILNSILKEVYGFSEHSEVTGEGEHEFRYYEVSAERIERFEGMLEMVVHVISELFMNLSEPLWWVDLKDFKAHYKRMREERQSREKDLEIKNTNKNQTN